MTNIKLSIYLNGGFSIEYTFMRVVFNVNIFDEKFYLSLVEFMEYVEDREEEVCGWLGCRFFFL